MVDGYVGKAAKAAPARARPRNSHRQEQGRPGRARSRKPHPDRADPHKWWTVRHPPRTVHSGDTSGPALSPRASSPCFRRHIRSGHEPPAAEPPPREFLPRRPAEPARKLFSDVNSCHAARREHYLRNEFLRSRRLYWYLSTREKTRMNIIIHELCTLSYAFRGFAH